MIKIFEHPTYNAWRELVLIDDENDLIKIYAQDKKLGFPFSVHTSSLQKFGYKSAEDFYESISKREKAILGHINIKKLDVTKQITSEIEGLVKLAKHRYDNNCYQSIILKDGQLYNDIVERLKAYEVTEEQSLAMIKEALYKTA